MPESLNTPSTSIILCPFKKIPVGTVRISDLKLITGMSFFRAHPLAKAINELWPSEWNVDVLTRCGVRANIGFCLSKRNGLRKLSCQFKSSQNAAERAA